MNYEYHVRRTKLDCLLQSMLIKVLCLYLYFLTTTDVIISRRIVRYSVLLISRHERND